jgi:hypothetical protein
MGTEPGCFAARSGEDVAGTAASALVTLFVDISKRFPPGPASAALMVVAGEVSEGASFTSGDSLPIGIVES